MRQMCHLCRSNAIIRRWLGDGGQTTALRVSAAAGASAGGRWDWSVRTAAFLLTLLILSCGGAQKGLDPKIPVDFAYVSDGRAHRLSELRRRPVVVVLMRTSEVVSQIYMEKVAEAYRRTAGRLRYLVLTVEGNEAPFVDTYMSFEKLPFPIGIAEKAVLYGDSDLGVIPGIPCTYFIDEEGHPSEVIPGVIEVDDLIGKAERF